MAFKQNNQFLKKNSKSITQPHHNNIDSINLTPDSKYSTKSLLTENYDRKFNFFTSLNDNLKAIIKKKSENSLLTNNKQQVILNNLNLPMLSNYSLEINNSSSSNYVCNQAEIGLRNYSNKDLFLSRLCKGPPELFRWTSWIIASNLDQIRNEDFYNYLLSQEIDINAEIQIKKDINRTITDEKLFSIDATKSKLYNVLKVYSIIDKEVSYCQGMNFIIAFLLIISDFNEVDTLYMMVNLFMSNNKNFGIRGFFMNNFPLLSLYIYQFNGIFNEYLPNLKKHFEKLEIPNELWISKWFQTLFTICMPKDVVVRLWDCILAKGLYFIFDFAITLMKSFEKDLLKYNDISDIADYFKTINPYFNHEKAIKFDIEALIKEALHLEIKSKLLNHLKKEYEDKFNTDLSVLQVNTNLEKIYNNYKNNKNYTGINENYSLEEEKKSHVKDETKSKFHNAIVKLDDANPFNSIINIDYISNHEIEEDTLSENCSELYGNISIVGNKIKAYTLSVQNHEKKSNNFNNSQHNPSKLL